MTPERKALLFEPSGHHYTLLPCYLSYLKQLGYDVTILAYRNFDSDLELCRVPWREEVSVVLFNDPDLSDVPHQIDFDLFDLVWVTTLNGSCGDRWRNPFEVLGFYPAPSNGLYGTLHAVCQWDKLGIDYSRMTQVFTLVDVGDSYPDLEPLSLSYFGEVSSAPIGGSKRTFLITGVSVSIPKVSRAIALWEGSFKGIVSCIGSTFGSLFWLRALVGQALYTCTGCRGRKWKGVVPLSPYKARKVFGAFRLKGSVASPTLYESVESSDYIIANFEGDALFRFSTSQISGQALLSLGFCKPLILAESVASFWGFDDRTAVVFPDGHFDAGLKKAMSLTPAEYSELQENIGLLKDSLAGDSLRRLKECIERCEGVDPLD